MINQKQHISQGRPPSDEGRDKKGDILDHAMTLFATQGIAGTTIAQIAKASNVTPAVVHYYFNNREGLIDSFVKQRIVPVVEYTWSGITEDILTDPEKIIFTFVDRLLDCIEKMPLLPMLWGREILNEGGLLRKKLIPFIPQNKIARAQKSFQTGQKQGKLNCHIEPNLMMTSIMAVVMLPLAAQSFINEVLAIPAYDKKTLREHAITLLLNGVLLRK